jgi:hypothetical protein
VRRAKDMPAGQRFGRLRIVTRSGSDSNGALWMCACDCGARVRVRGYEIRSGSIQSCGCLRREVASAGAWIHRRALGGS